MGKRVICQGLTLCCAVLISSLYAHNTLANKTVVGDALALQIINALEFTPEQRIAFREVQHNPLLKQPLTQSGRLWIETHGDLVMLVQTPRLEERRLSNDVLQLKRPSPRLLRRWSTDHAKLWQHTRARRVHLNPEKSAHLVLVAVQRLVHGSADELGQWFHLSTEPQAQSEAAQWRIRLTPNTDRLSQQMQFIEVAGAAQRLHSMRVERGSQGWQQLTFEP